MSYARFGVDGSDVYVYLSVERHLTCSGCKLLPRVAEITLDEDMAVPVTIDPIVETKFATTAELLRHLDLHKAVGHYIPSGLRSILRNAAKANDAWIAGLTALPI